MNIFPPVAVLQIGRFDEPNHVRPGQTIHMLSDCDLTKRTELNMNEFTPMQKLPERQMKHNRHTSA